MSNLGIAQSEITGASGSSGSSTVTFRGAWSNVTAYSTNDLVTRKGSVWIAVTGNTGNDPYLDNGTNWTLFAEGFNYAGTWSNGTTYNFFDVVTYNNSFYLSVVAGSQSNIGHNPQTDNGTHWILLDQGFNFLGAWGVGTTYNPYDVVTYQSSTYICTLQVTGGTGPASDTAHWALLAAAGQVAPRQTEIFTMPVASVTSVQITTNVVTLSVVNTFTSQGEGTGQGQVNTIYCNGFTNATFLNGQVLTIVTINGTTITANFTHANYGPTAEPGGAIVTLSIPINGVYWTTIPLGKTFALSYIQCLQANRIELYSTSAARTADASRPATTQPTQFTQHGVILDLNLDGVQASFTSWVLSPLAYGADLNVPATPSNSIQAALTNIGGAPTSNTFQITFTFTFEESGGVSSPNADEYVLGATDATNLPNAVANPTAYFGTEAAPGTPGSLDDEFGGASLNTATRWTWANQGSAVATVSKSILTLSDSPQGSGSAIVRYIWQTAPATPYQTTFGAVDVNAITDFSGGGFAVQDGATNRATLFVKQHNTSTGGDVVVVAHFTDLNTFSTAPFSAAIAFFKARYMQFKDDGVNHTFYISEDGVNFFQVWQESRTVFLANPNRVGLLVYPNSTTSAGSSSTFPVQTNTASFDWFRRTI